MKFRALAGTAIVIAFCGLVAGPGAADEDRFETPAMGESGTPDQDLGHSESADVDDVGAENPDNMDVGAEDPDAPGRVTGARSADAEPGRASTPDADLGRSDDLGSLGNAAAEDAAAQRLDEREVESRDGIRLQTEIGSVHDAKLAVASAKERVARAEAAYSEMITSGYPRGEARQRIIDERNLAKQDLQAAEQAYDRVLRGPASAQ